MNRIDATLNPQTKFAVVSNILCATNQDCYSVPSYEDDAQEIQVNNYGSFYGATTGCVITVDFSQNLNAHIFIPPELYFRQLVMKWRGERGATSSITTMSICPSYQRIIAMGASAIPLILREMESEDDPDHWSWALRALTGANPVPDAVRGNMKATAQAWLNWARGKYAW